MGACGWVRGVGVSNDFSLSENKLLTVTLVIGNIRPSSVYRSSVVHHLLCEWSQEFGRVYNGLNRTVHDHRANALFSEKGCISSCINTLTTLFEQL